MRFPIIGLSILILSFLGCKQKNRNINYLVTDDKDLPALADGVRYSYGNWETKALGEPYNSIGNHRAVVKLDK